MLFLQPGRGNNKKSFQIHRIVPSLILYIRSALPAGGLSRADFNPKTEIINSERSNAYVWAV